jgi:hypothetical protein
LLTASSKLVDYLGQAVRTQVVDSLSTGLLQDVRFDNQLSITTLCADLEEEKKQDRLLAGY